MYMLVDDTFKSACMMWYHLLARPRSIATAKGRSRAPSICMISFLCSPAAVGPFLDCSTSKGAMLPHSGLGCCNFVLFSVIQTAQSTTVLCFWQHSPDTPCELQATGQSGAQSQVQFLHFGQQVHLQPLSVMRPPQSYHQVSAHLNCPVHL